MTDTPHQSAPTRLTKVFSKTHEERYGLFNLFKRYVTEQKERPFIMDYGAIKRINTRKEGGSRIFFKIPHREYNPHTKSWESGERLDHEDIKESLDEIEEQMDQKLRKIYGPK